MKKVISIILMIIIAFRNISMTVCGEENTNLMAVTIPIISNSQIDKIDAYVNMNTLENETQIFITTNDFSNLMQMEEILNNETNTVWNKGFNYFVLDKQKTILKVYYIIGSETIIDIKKVISSKEVETFKCQYINNIYYIDMQSAFQYLHIDYDCNFEINSDKYIAINCIDTLDMLQKEYISNLNLYRYSYVVDRNEVNKSKGIKILDENGLDIFGLVYDIEKERENISVDEYYKCLNIGLVEEGLEWLDYESDSIEYVVLDKKLQKGADKFQQYIIDELKSIDSNTLKSVGTLESIVNGIGHIITLTGIAIDTLDVEVEREQEKYIIETIFNDIKKTEYTQEYFSLLSNSILQEYQYYAVEDNVDINNRKEFSEYMKNHKYAYRNGVRYNDTDIIRNTAILLYSDFCSYLNGEEYAKHIDINAFIEHYFNIMETTISLGFNLDSTEVASQYAIANDCYSFFIENNKDEFTWWQSLTDYSDNIITSYNFYNLRNAFLNVNSTSNLLSKDSLIGSQKMEIMMLKALLKASESNPDFITDNQKQEIETSLKASSNLLFRLENCVVTYENNLPYKSIYNNSNNSELKLQNCNWLLDLNKNYDWHLDPTIEADDIIVSDSEKIDIYGFNANPFDEYSIVKQNGKYRFIKYDGTYISDKQYDKWYFSKPDVITLSSDNNENEISILGYDDNKIIYKTDSAGWGRQGFYMDNSTKDIYYIEYGSYYQYEENNNMAVQSADISIISSDKNQLGIEYNLNINNIGKYGIANNSGLVVDCVYDDACMNFGDNIIALEKDGKWGYFNKDGTQVIDFVCEPFESKILDVMWLHNHDDENVQHPYLSSYGYIPVKIDDQCGYYDTQGNEVIPCGTFEEVRPVHNGLAWVKKDGKWGVIELEDIEQEESKVEEISDLIIETGKLTNSDIKSEWTHVTSLDLEYPIFSTSDKELQNFLNTAITEKILSYMETNTDYNVNIFGGFEYDMSLNNYLSINASVSNVAEGANGFPYQCYTFFVDLQNRKVLILNELFSEPENVVYNEIATKTNQYISDNVKSALLSQTALSDYDYSNCKFILNKDNLIIIFNPYEVTVGNAGFINIEIPLSDLSLTCVVSEVRTKGFQNEDNFQTQNEPTEEQPDNATVSDYEILDAVNQYLEENQSHLGDWLSDSGAYCPAEYMASNSTNWSCPINNYEYKYSPTNYIAGSYPYYAFVDKETLTCTITANYYTEAEFDLSNYLN